MHPDLGPTLTRGGLTRVLADRPRLRSSIRATVRALNTPVAKARLMRTLRAAPRPLCVEIGGLQSRPGWVVTNVSATTKLYLDATRRWPLEDGAAEYIFSDNVVEHVPLADCRVMLAEAHRCLRPGGVIRVVTPDIRAHIDMYLAGEESLTNEASRHYRNGGQVVVHPIDLLRVPISSFGHHTGYVYDFETLAAELKRAGFSSPVRCALGLSEHSALAGLDIRNYGGGAQMALEATA